MKRDMREWLVLMPVAFFFIFGLIGFFTGGGNINLSYLRNYSHISWPVGQVVLLFLYSLSNGSIAASSIGREGDSAWILRVLPVRGLHIAYGKLWISWIIPFILLTVLEVIISFLLGWSFIFLVVGILMKAVITLGSSSIGLWLGTIGAKYHPTNPQARLKVTTSLFLFVSSYIYLGLILLPFAIIVIPPELVAFEAESPQAINGFFTKLMYSILLLISYKTTSAGLVISLCIAGIIMIALSTTIIFNRLSARRIDRGITIQRVKETRDTPLFGRNKSDRGGSLY